MKYYVNGEQRGRLECLAKLKRAALEKGYDQDEAIGVFLRAESTNEDGECARDELFAYHDGIEILGETE